MEIPVAILTDHANLMHWKATRKVNRWVARWFAELKDYNLVIKHIPGKIHMAPDMLLRPPGADCREKDNSDIVLLPPSMFIAMANAKEDTLKQRVKEAQQEHKAEMELWCDTQGSGSCQRGMPKAGDWPYHPG